MGGVETISRISFRTESPFSEVYKGYTQGVKLTFFCHSHFTPKFFKVVANSKKLVAIFNDKTFFTLSAF